MTVDDDGGQVQMSYLIIGQFNLVGRSAAFLPLFLCHPQEKKEAGDDMWITIWPSNVGI